MIKSLNLLLVAALSVCAFAAQNTTTVSGTQVKDPPATVFGIYAITSTGRVYLNLDPASMAVDLVTNTLRSIVVGPAGPIGPPGTAGAPGPIGPAGPGTSGNFFDAEVPLGALDGTNASFTLVRAPVGLSLQLFRNGIVQKAGFDYDLSVNLVRFKPGAVPSAGDTLLAWYRTTN